MYKLYLIGLKRVLKIRMKMVEDRIVDWVLGEIIVYMFLLIDGYSVRFSGQDVERGIFRLVFKWCSCIMLDYFYVILVLIVNLVDLNFRKENSYLMLKILYEFMYYMYKFCIYLCFLLYDFL